MYIPIWILIVTGIVFFIYYNKRKAQDKSFLLSTPEEKEIIISEEAIFKAQSQFEDKITNETEFPNAISGDEIYIYKNLMRPWFDKLIAQYRYDDKMTQKLRNDWLDYMSTVDDRSTYNYLSLESEDEEESKRYREDHIAASRKMFAVQDAFATAVGPDAVSELKKVREMGLMSFGRHGELAPEGFKLDLGRRELIPVKNKKEVSEK